MADTEKFTVKQLEENVVRSRSFMRECEKEG